MGTPTSEAAISQAAFQLLFLTFVYPGKSQRVLYALIATSFMMSVTEVFIYSAASCPLQLSNLEFDTSKIVAGDVKEEFWGFFPLIFRLLFIVNVHLIF